MTNITFVLGAADPEMAAIERALDQARVPYVYAYGPDGRRVHPGNAYQALPIERDDGGLVLVECGWPDQPQNAIIVDHHRPGDPGYGRPPQDYWEASSVGQIVALLQSRGLAGPYHALWGGDTGDDNGVFDAGDHSTLAAAIAATANVKAYHCFYGRQVTVLVGGRPVNVWLSSGEWAATSNMGLAYIAAADHCLGHAYAGRCPGVDPDALMRWRAESRAAFQRRPVEDVLADEERAEAALHSAPKITIAGVLVADFGDATVPELPEAACRLGIPFVATVSERVPYGRRKQVLQAAPAEVVTGWMAMYPGSYGDPARGFAGRVL